MPNAITMTHDLEQQRKRNALLLTLGVGIGLLLLFILLKWPIPTVSQPVAEEFIDVNLGNGDVGSGKDQPQLPGDPAPAAAAYAPPSHPAVANDVKQVETDDNGDGPAIKNPVNASPNATKINDDNKPVKATPNATPTPAPPVPKPRAVMGQMTGGDGTGGNGADTYKPSTGEGIAGGSGDQGRNGGNPNGGVYTGTPRRINAQVISMPTQTMQDEFRESGFVTLDVTVNEDGRLLSAAYNPRGSSFPRSSRQAQIALQRARELRFPKVDGGFKQDIRFNFTVGN